jgi:hemerythrin-like domain-containing protein
LEGRNIGHVTVMATRTTTKSAAKKSAAKKTPARKSAARKSTAKKAAARKSTAKKTTAKKTTAKKTTAKKAAARKTTAKKAASRSSSTAKRAAKAVAKKAAPSRAKKATAKRTTSTTSSRPTDAIALLKQDHREIKDLFEKFEKAGPNAHTTRESTVEDIIEKLSVHAGIEEAVFYPAVRERIRSADEDVLEALEEHHVAKQTLAELQRMNSQDERFTAKVTVLIESVRHHLEEEEGELFPEVRKEFTRTELEEMAERLANARTIAPSRPHPHAPDEPPANLAANIIAAPLDAAASAAESVAEKVREIVS